MPTSVTASPQIDSGRRRAIGFLNWAHAIDHFVLLIYPTVVIGLEVIYRPALFRADRAFNRLIRRVRRVFASRRLARRPLEPAQHDGGLLPRLRPVAHRRRLGAESVLACRGAVCARRLRGDLSPGRHGDADRDFQRARAHDGVQRRVRKSRRRARGGDQRGARAMARLARGLRHSRRRLRGDRDRLSADRARRPPPRCQAQVGGAGAAHRAGDGSDVRALPGDLGHRRPHLQHHPDRGSQDRGRAAGRRAFRSSRWAGLPRPCSCAARSDSSSSDAWSRR